MASPFRSVDDRIAEMDPDQVTTVLRQLPDEEGTLE